MNLHKLEDTFEKQERKELIFELCYKLIPLVFLLFLFSSYLDMLSSIFRITNIFHTEKGGNKNE